jgi:hypothetical protein
MALPIMLVITLLRIGMNKKSLPNKGRPFLSLFNPKIKLVFYQPQLSDILLVTAKNVWPIHCFAL